MLVLRLLMLRLRRGLIRLLILLLLLLMRRRRRRRLWQVWLLYLIMRLR